VSQTIRRQGRSRETQLYGSPAGTPGRRRGAEASLEGLGLREGEELTAAVKRESFYEVARELQVEAVEEVDRILWEVRGRGRRLYG